MNNLFYAVFCAIFGNAVVYSSLAFINGEFYTELFKSAYDQTSVLTRLVISSVVFFPLANFLISRVYKFVDPAQAGMIIIAALVAVIIAKSILLGFGTINVRTLLASTLLLASAIWVSYELHHVK